MNPSNTPSTLLSVDNLSVDFQLEDGKTFRALHGMNFDINDGEIVALVGESGSGKSVASLAVMGLLQKEIARVASGSIFFQGCDLLTMREEERRAIRGRDIAMIFQDPMTSLNPVHPIKKQIAEMLALHKSMTGALAMSRVLDLLNEVGMLDPERIANAYPHQLSGGQQQRVMIAMALSCEPQLIIADEPTTALDVTIQKQVLELMVSLQKKHRMAILFITHDLALVKQLAQRVVVLRHGRVRERGRVEAIFSSPQDSYTKALLACRPPREGRPDHLPVIADFMSEDNLEHKPITSLTAKPSSNFFPSHITDETPLMEVVSINTWLGKNSYFGGRRRAHIVKDVSFTLKRGETLGVVGESGSGKTTLGLSLLRLKPAKGEVRMDEKNLLMLSEKDFLPYRRRLQIIFQNPLSSLNPRFTVGDVLTEPLRVHGIGDNALARQKIALRLLDQVGLPATSWNRYPHEFSGGQCQRIAIARSLTLNPEILICDESVSALDVSIQAQILNLLRDLQKELGLSYLFISHDLNVVRYLSHRVMVMNQGAVVEENTADALFKNPQSEYTRQLLAAMPAL